MLEWLVVCSLSAQQFSHCNFNPHLNTPQPKLRSSFSFSQLSFNSTTKTMILFLIFTVTSVYCSAAHYHVQQERIDSSTHQDKVHKPFLRQHDVSNSTQQTVDRRNLRHVFEPGAVSSAPSSRPSTAPTEEKYMGEMDTITKIMIWLGIIAAIALCIYIIYGCYVHGFKQRERFDTLASQAETPWQFIAHEMNLLPWCT